MQELLFAGARRSDYVRVSEDLKADLGATRTDLAAAENFLGERVTRETEERRKAEGLLRGETAAELEALREHHERRAQEAQRVATEISKELMDLEFSKRDGQFNEMKHHVDFCTKVRAGRGRGRRPSGRGALSVHAQSREPGGYVRCCVFVQRDAPPLTRSCRLI